jgi:integrase
MTRRLRRDRQPALVYLATLAPGASRDTARSMLTGLARLASDGRHDLASFSWHRLSYRDTQRLRRLVAEHYQPAGANLRLAMLRRVLDEAFRLGLMGATQYQRARAIRNVRGSSPPRGRALDQRELRRLVQTCRSSGGPKGARDAAIFAVLYATGARRHELVGIQWPEDVDLRRALLTLRTKGRRHRTADLQAPIRQALSDWLRERGRKRGPLFVSVDRLGRLGTKPLSPGAILKLCKTRAAAAGVRDFTPHDLRRTFASELLDAGVDLHVAQEMLDHANIATTARYDPGRGRRRHAAAGRLRIPF